MNPGFHRRKKLIEVALPLPEINDASAYDKMPGIGPHPKGIHHWWARLPLPVSRAVLFASVVDDPSAHPEKFPTEEAQERERERLFGIIRRLMQKQLHKHPEVYAGARAEMLKHCGGKLPPMLDPFAGGGSIPLEAARLGMEAYAGDLNPIAVLLNKCNLELAPQWVDWPPVNPESPTKYLGAPASLGARASRPLDQLGACASLPPHLGTRASRPQDQGTRPSRPHKTWHSRGYLPHFDSPGLIQSITFRLHDSVPRSVIEEWKQELGWRDGTPASDPRSVELRRRIAQYEDAGQGECWLASEDIGQLVEDALLHFDGARYRLLAWCVMPNHVHVVIETMPGYLLGEVVHSWKSFTAKEANKLLGRTGDFWMPDYYDRFIRDEEHLAAAIAYVENNPVAAGLVERAEEWGLSSAAAKNAAGTAALPAKNAAETAAFPGWVGAQGLAADVRYYGRLILERAREKIGHLYPPVKVTAEMVAGSAGVSPARPDLKPYVGKELPVIAWIWARTVASPNPAARGAHVPLMSTFWLSSKKGSEAWLEPIVDRAAGTWRFAVRTGPPKDREAVRRYLAWESILQDKDALDLSPHQVRQAEEQKRAADSTVAARLPETFQWLLGPTQAKPRAGAEWQAIRLTGNDALAVRASKKLRNEELLVMALAGTRLRMELDRVPLWRGDHVPIKQLIEDFARYLYLPRLKDPGVVIRAIRHGLALITWEQESFAYAESFDEGARRYRGLRAGQQVPIPDTDPPGLLVKPEAARPQLDAEQRAAAPLGGAGAVTGARVPSAAGQGIGESAPVAVVPARPERFHGSVPLDPTRVGRDASRIAEEVIAHLAGLPGAEVRVTLEIEATVPDGVPDNVERTVTENSRTLKFSSHGFERE